MLWVTSVGAHVPDYAVSQPRRPQYESCKTVGFCCSLPEFCHLLGCYAVQVSHRHFGTTYQSHLQGLRYPRGTSWHTDHCRWDWYVIPKNWYETNLGCVTSQKTTEFNINLHWHENTVSHNYKHDYFAQLKSYVWLFSGSYEQNK